MLSTLCMWNLNSLAIIPYTVGSQGRYLFLKILPHPAPFENCYIPNVACRKKYKVLKQGHSQDKLTSVIFINCFLLAEIIKLLNIRR